MDTIKICPGCRAPLPADAPEGLCPQCLAKVALGTEPAAPAASVPPDLARVAGQFPQLEILELLGRGGMGMVYKARQLKLDRFVALKLLPVVSADAATFGVRFQREARALARLNHPGIVDIYDFGQTDDFYYFIMEYVDGMNLRQLLRTGTVAPKTALDIVSQICTALQFAHDEGVVHRDIKPENILITRRGHVKIADFGLAKLLGHAPETNLTVSQMVMGTPNYMAPEQRQTPLEVDHRADIYSLGVVFYELLTGEVPMGKFEPPSHRVQVDVRLDEVVLRALEREPGRRYQQISEVKTGVETITAAPPVTPAPAPAPANLPVTAPRPANPAPPPTAAPQPQPASSAAPPPQPAATAPTPFRERLKSIPDHPVLAHEVTRTALLLLGGSLLAFVLARRLPHLSAFMFVVAITCLALTPIVIYRWAIRRSAAGTPWRSLPRPIRRRALLQTAALCLLTCVLIPLSVEHATTSYTRQREAWFYPGSGAYEKLVFSCNLDERSRRSGGLNPHLWSLTLGFSTFDYQTHNLVVKLPGLLTDLEVGFTSESPLFDRTLLAEWMLHEAKINTTLPKVQTEMDDIVRLINNYKDAAPGSWSEFRDQAERDLNAEVDRGDFQFGGTYGGQEFASTPALFVNLILLVMTPFLVGRFWIRHCAYARARAEAAAV